MVHMGCSKDQKPIGIVPWGGPRGADWDDGSYDGVREINLTYGNSCIGTIQVTYEKNCAMIQGPKHGSHGGQTAAQIKLQYPEEYLTAVTGHYSVLRDLATPSPVVRSLTFKTNKKTYGPFGHQEGTPFSFGMEGGKIVGFRGRSGWYLDAIGFNIVAA